MAPIYTYGFVLDNKLKVYDMRISDLNTRIQMMKSQKTSVNKKFDEAKKEYNDVIDALLLEMNQELSEVE